MKINNDDMDKNKLKCESVIDADLVILFIKSTPTQSGSYVQYPWVLQYNPGRAAVDLSQDYDSIMGWHSSGDYHEQVEMRFATLEEAENYSVKMGYRYYIESKDTNGNNRKIKQYIDNFQ